MMEIYRGGPLGGRTGVWVLVVALWVVANGSLEGTAQGESKVCMVRTNTREKIDDSSSIATANIAFGGKGDLASCVNTCSVHPECHQAMWDSHNSKCYRNKVQSGPYGSSESQNGFTSMRCVPAPQNKRTKICKVLNMIRHVEPHEANRIDLNGGIKYGGTAETQNSCLEPCAVSSECMETTWSRKDKKCYPSKEALVHDVTDGSGDFWTLQCVVLSDEEIKGVGADGQSVDGAGAEAQNLANQTQVDGASGGNNQTTPDKEIDNALQQQKQLSPGEAKQEERIAAQKAEAAEELAKESEEELKQEKSAKAKAKEQQAERGTKAKVAAKEASKAKAGEGKEKAVQAAKVAKEKDEKAKEKELVLAAEGRDKKEQKVKADEKAKKAATKKENTDKALKVAKMAQEKRSKADKWHGKGHLLFAQGIKYQGLLESFSKASHQLDAYHYRRELETYTDAFPQGFTAPLSSEDGELGKTAPAGTMDELEKLKVTKEKHKKAKEKERLDDDIVRLLDIH